MYLDDNRDLLVIFYVIFIYFRIQEIKTLQGALNR